MLNGSRSLRAEDSGLYDRLFLLDGRATTTEKVDRIRYILDVVVFMSIEPRAVPSTTQSCNLHYPPDAGEDLPRDAYTW